MRNALILVAASLALVACQPKAAAPTMSAAEAEAVMAEARTEAGASVLPSGLVYKVVRSGPESGLRPQLTDEVKVHYEGKLADGHVFDSSYERGAPAAMPLRRLIPAWQEALTLMHPGDEWILHVPSKLGYGPEGAGGGKIPGGAVLIFRIELIDVLPGPGRIMRG